jgi:hypothetical protein
MSARAEAAEEGGKFRRLGRAFIPYFTAGWSAEGISRASQVTAAMLGLAAPLAVGVMSGHAKIAVALALGYLMWSRVFPPAVAAVESKRNPAGNAGNRANKLGRFDHPG